jgi:hypothetical protein
MARRTITKFIPVIVASVFAAGYQSLAQQSGSVTQAAEGVAPVGSLRRL